MGLINDTITTRRGRQDCENSNEYLLGLSCV